MFWPWTSNGLTPGESARMRRIERKLDLLVKHLGIADGAADSDPADPGKWPIEILQPADGGRKIDAIKAHREVFGSSLAETKNAIEAYMGR
jgi:ribosomal protein L7/L12